MKRRVFLCGGVVAWATPVTAGQKKAAPAGLQQVGVTTSSFSGPLQRKPTELRAIRG